MNLDSPIRIILADDHPLIRLGLRLGLQANRDISIVAEAADGEAALAKIKEFAPDVAILDIDMPKMGGLDVTRQVRVLTLPTKLILLTLHTEAIYLRAAIESGADGYLLKENASEDVLAAIRAVLSGQRYVSPTMVHHLIGDGPESTGNSLLSKLSPAERRIMSLIAEGKASKDIGDELGIHYRTVDNHRTNICRKLSLEGTNSLARFALQHKGEF